MIPAETLARLEAAQTHMLCTSEEMRELVAFCRTHQWQPIESAPKDGTVIVGTGLNYGQEISGRHYAIVTFEDGEWVERTEWGEESTLHYLTHWMPLPAPPNTAISRPAETQGNAADSQGSA